MSSEINLTVPHDFPGQTRVDKYIAQAPVEGGMNRSRLKSGLLSLRVNGKEERLSRKVKAGDNITIVWQERIPDGIEPQNIPLDIIYEDENVCVINKAQGMVVHPANGNWSGTLVNALLYHFGESKALPVKDSGGGLIASSYRAGIVHRLDKDTSGVIITAKNAATQEVLEAQFRSHRGLVKEYIAICRGRPPSKAGVIKTLIARDGRDRKRFKAVPLSGSGKEAVTYYKCVSCYGEYSLMKFRLATGRTHQIRVHAKYINCPVLGDPVYSKRDSLFPDATLMLHARLLKINIPEKGECVFKSPTPSRFLRVMRVLKSRYKKVLL